MQNNFRHVLAKNNYLKCKTIKRTYIINAQ